MPPALRDISIKEVTTHSILELITLQAAHSSGAASAYTHWHGAVDGGPQRRLSEALGATPVAPVVIPAPRVVEPAPRAATVAQPARQTSSVPGADMASRWLASSDK